MQVSQIYQIVNSITSEILGDSAVVNEDLSNVVEIGDTIANLGSAAFENMNDNEKEIIGDTFVQNVLGDLVFNCYVEKILCESLFLLLFLIT